MGHEDNRTLEQVYRSAVSGLYARLRSNYDFIYNRFGDEGIKLIEDILNNYTETFANENIKLEKSYNFNDSSEIKISPEQIQIAFENLFNNSIHAYNSVKKSKQEKIIKVIADFIENKFRMIIEDNGPGMPPDVSKDIFSMFFSMKDKESAKGLGIGLYITRWIIEDCHKGNIDVESREGEFTRFIITLPVDGDKI